MPRSMSTARQFSCSDRTEMARLEACGRRRLRRSVVETAAPKPGIGDGYLASSLAAETSLVTCANISPTTAITSRDSKPLFRSSR